MKTLGSVVLIVAIVVAFNALFVSRSEVPTLTRQITADSSNANWAPAEPFQPTEKWIVIQELPFPKTFSVRRIAAVNSDGKVVTALVTDPSPIITGEQVQLTRVQYYTHLGLMADVIFAVPTNPPPPNPNVKN